MSRLSESLSLPFAVVLALTPTFANATCTRENIVRAGAVADATTGEILSSHGNIDEEFNPASLTKIGSNLVAFEAIRNGQMSLDQIITVAPAQDGYGGDRLTAGTRMTLENALRASSASQNGVYIGIARAYPGGESAFIRRLNEIVQLAGAENTNFINTNGLFLFNVSQNCASHHTTIRDLFRILHYAHREYPNEMRQYFGQPRIEYNQSDPNMPSLPRLNPTSALLADRDAIAARESIFIQDVKTGFVRYSAAHILASASINNHLVFGIETGMAQGRSSENQWYRIRDVALLNAFRYVRDQYLGSGLVAYYNPPASSESQNIRVTFSGSYAPAISGSLVSPARPLRDNFLPPALQRWPAPRPARETVADILPTHATPSVTIEM